MPRTRVQPTEMMSLLDLLLPARHRAALTDEFTLHDNPVLQRDERRDSRRRDHPLLLLIALATLLLGGFGAGLLLRWLAGRHLLRHGVPPWAGGNYGTAALVLVSGLHVAFIYHASWRRTGVFFLQEYRHNTLFTLLCTRIPTFQLILQAAMHPFRQAMLIAFAGLPFYAFAFSLGASLWDILGLYLFYAMLAFRPPRWVVPVFGGFTPEQILKFQRSGRGLTSFEAYLKGIGWSVPFCQYFFNWAFGNGWFMKVAYPLWTLVPRDLGFLLISFVLSWALCLTRFLWTPLTWYTLTVAPILFVLPLYICGRLLVIWESSLFLRSGDVEQNRQLWDAGDFWRSRRTYWFVVTFLLLGYLWQPYVRQHLTAVFISLNGGRLNLALAGVAWICGCWAAIAVWSRMGEMCLYRRTLQRIAEGRSNEILPPSPERLVLRAACFILLPLLTAYGLYIAACLLGDANPFPAPVPRLIGQMLAVTATGALLVGGLNYRYRLPAYVWLVPLLGWAIPVPAFSAWVSALSPVTGLLGLTPHTQRILNVLPYLHPQVPSWEQSLLVTGVLGMAALAISLTRRAPDLRTDTAAQGTGGVHEAQKSIDEAMVAEGEAPPGAIPMPTAQMFLPEPAELPPAEGEGRKRKKFVEKKDHPLALQLIAWLQRFGDNAIVTKETRVLLRGHLGRDEQIALGIVLALILTTVFYYVDMVGDILEAPAQFFFGPQVTGAGRVLGGMVTVSTFILAIAMPLAAATVCGAAFVRERERSTMGFILVTPLSTRTIVLGKYVGLLTPTLLAMAVLTAWNGLLALLLMLFVGPVNALIGWTLAVALPLTLLLLAGVLALAASTLFRREADASGMAFLALIGILGLMVYPVMCVNDIDLWRTIFPVATGMLSSLAGLLIAGSLFGSLAWWFTCWRIDLARVGDVAFESAKR